MPTRPSLRPAVVALALLLTLPSPAMATEPPTLRPPAELSPPGTQHAFVADQLLVRFDPSVTAVGRGEMLRSEHATLRRHLAVAGQALVQLPTGTDVVAAAAAWQRKPGVLFAEPNFIYEPAAAPNDPRFSDLWGLHNPDDHDIDAPEAWNLTTGSPDVIVAVVDSGVDYDHPDLAPNVWTNSKEQPDGVDNDGNGLVDDLHGWDFVASDNDPMDQNGHGTHVAGTIGARGNNGVGMTGVNWRVSIMPLRAGNAQGSLTNADVADSIAYACDQGARVVNGSFGGPGNSSAIRIAIESCPEALFVFAAGNGGNDGSGDDNDSTPVYPCNYASDNIVCVAATGPDDELTAFSNYGATKVDLAAPGAAILSASYKRILFRDGFESGLASWVVDKVSGKSWSRSSEVAASGSYSATDSASSNYDNDSDTWIETSSPINMGGGSNCTLEFNLRLDTEPGYDYLVLQGSADGGGSWSVIDGGAAGNNAASGSTGGFFQHVALSLQGDGFDGTPSFDLRFRLVSDFSVTGDGAQVDDVMVLCRTASHGSNDYVAMSGTSMATPHVAGVAALVLAAHPHLTTSSVKQALLDGVDALPGLAGLLATGGRLNARGALDAVDGIGPVAARPAQRLVSNSTLSASAVPMRVSWSAATDAAPSSGIWQYRLQQRTKSGGAWGPWSNVATTTSLKRTVKLPAGTHQFRLRAQDRAGNWGAWKRGASFVLRDPQAEPAITFDGTWRTQSAGSFYEGSSRHATARQRTATHTFTGSQVAWVSVRGPNRGRAKVYIDGTLTATVDLYRSAAQFRRVVFVKTWSTSGTHTIEIKIISRNASSSGYRVDLDAFLTRS